MIKLISKEKKQGLADYINKFFGLEEDAARFSFEEAFVASVSTGGVIFIIIGICQVYTKLQTKFNQK